MEDELKKKMEECQNQMKEMNESVEKQKIEQERLEEEHRKYCQTRESGGMESFGLPHYLDFQEQMSNDFSRQEARETDYALENAHFMKERNFDMIDIGTAFYVGFDSVYIFGAFLFFAFD